jgi:hypothetical protein
MLLGLLLVAAATSAVLAAKPANPSCWGVVTSQRAVAVGDLGEHSSTQDTPRMGLGNFARFLHDLGLTAGPHISDTGTVAAGLDAFPETSCP